MSATATTAIEARSASERAHFDALAERTAEIWWGHRTPAAPLRMRRRIDLLERRMPASGQLRLLELGCGAGIFTQALAERWPGACIVGVDISPKAAEVARVRCADWPGVSIEVADVVSPEFDYIGFDAIVGNSVLHHLPLEECLGNALRALTPGGLLWFSEPNMLNPQVALERNVGWIGRRLDNSPDETAFFRWSLKRALEAAGFVDVAVTPFDFLHPACPSSLLKVAERFGRALEAVPGVREIAGSLEVVARRPQ
jgi:2-polyprenyl-3-methyl-5-hydroxy-6-metoxy-1,4-benzoquinol methylase